ncbi:MAG: hypothetical protein OK457_04765 [Thaumarchaeota archaeon]|nr:hypothetical protein [Nitrososphaerota archaeon]
MSSSYGSGGVRSDSLTGIEQVVVGVKEMSARIELFKRVYGLDEPLERKGALEDCIVAAFRNTPVCLASPVSGESWLSKRLSQFGDSPCAYLLGSGDTKGVKRRYNLVTSDKSWFQNNVSWINNLEMPETRIWNR